MSNNQVYNESPKSSSNIPRFFVYNRQIAWVLLMAILLWGVYGYFKMPKRKDPEIPVHKAVAVAIWPGASSEKMEELVTRKIEEKVAQNPKVEKIRSISRTGISIVYVDLMESVDNTAKEFDDIKMKLDTISDLPEGCNPIMFNRDFGDTAALTMTVASPKPGLDDLRLKAHTIYQTLIKQDTTIPAKPDGKKVYVIVCIPQTIDARTENRILNMMVQYSREKKFFAAIHPFKGPGFLAFDAYTQQSESEINQFISRFIKDSLGSGDLPPDVWSPAILFAEESKLTGDNFEKELTNKLAQVAGDKYTYHELDQYTDLIRRNLQRISQVSKIERAGLLEERICLDYSQERLASYGLQPMDLAKLLKARNITFPGGNLEVNGKNINIDPSGEFKTEREIGNVMVTASPNGSPVYLRDLVDISRDYVNPPRFLNFYHWKDSQGQWHRSRAITVAIQMRQGEQIAVFGQEVDRVFKELEGQLPKDLIIARVSDQPLQTKETVDLFMKSLYEAIILVVVVAFIGFWEWRSALLMAISIPLTLAMTFGMMSLLGIDLQFVSIGSMIIALGLLVDVPVVSGDAIKRELEAKALQINAAWRGPTKLSKAILFATITNIVAYLPFLLLSGSTGKFLYSLPVVLACSLIASYIIAMSLIPLLSYYLLRTPQKHTPPISERRTKGFPGFYYQVGTWAIHNRYKVVLMSLVVLITGVFFLTQLKTQFFPKDLSYLSYVDIWLPEDAPLSVTNESAGMAENIIKNVCEDYGKNHPDKQGHPKAVLESLTSFVGGGGPRFWFSVEPEIQQLNYAQVIILVKDKHDTNQLVGPIQAALQNQIPGARVDVRQLETGKPVGIPVSIRISGNDMNTLRLLAEKVKTIFREIPDAERTRDDWGAENFTVNLKVDSDRANLSGITNLDVAASSAMGISGIPITVLREGDKQIPLVARLRMEERAQLSDINNLYVYSLTSPQKVPLRTISSIQYRMETEKIMRRNQFRTITISCFPGAGKLPSEVLNQAMAKLKEFKKQLPLGYTLEIGGEQEEQDKGFKELAVVMLISILLIYLALVIQFKNAIKPFIVFAAIPYGMCGAFIGLALMGSPFGFMAFLGVASLIGVIVSHIIVLFDFIEEKQEAGEPLLQALLDAGIIRLRPVMITVGATVFGLIPLALHGGPLWEPLCYAQIGGLTLATFITLLLVPTFYAICVLDLKIIKWKGPLLTELKEEEGNPNS